MTASILNQTTYSNVAANTVNGAVIDAAAIAEWRQNVKAVVDQHASEINAHSSGTISRVTLITEPYDQVTKTTVTLGFKPKLLTIDACILGNKHTSIGYVDGSAVQYSRHIFAPTMANQVVGNVCIKLADDASNYVQGVVTITDTGLEITWTKAGTLSGVSGNRRLIISAITHGE